MKVCSGNGPHWDADVEVPVVALGAEAGKDPGGNGQLEPDGVQIAEAELQARPKKKGQVVIPRAYGPHPARQPNLVGERQGAHRSQAEAIG